jgi:hypothetical protein
MEEGLKAENMKPQYKVGDTVVVRDVVNNKYYQLKIDSINDENITGGVFRQVSWPGEEVIAFVDSFRPMTYNMNKIVGFSKTNKSDETAGTHDEGEKAYLEKMLNHFLEFLNTDHKANFDYSEEPLAENSDESQIVAIVTLEKTGDKLTIGINEEDSGEIWVRLPDGKQFMGGTDDAANFVNKFYGLPTTTMVPDVEKEEPVAAKPEVKKEPEIPETPEQMNFKSKADRINHIKKLIDEKGEDIMKYSEAELQVLRTYEGMGGQTENKKGVDVGLLDQFYTPYRVIEKMWGLAFKHGFTFTGKKHICEPSCGIGRFFEYIPEGHDVTGYEIDKYAYTIAKLTFQKFAIVNEPFETHFWDIRMNIKRLVRPEYDLFIGNPPYRALESKYTLMKDVTGRTEKEYTQAETFDQYMLMRGVDLLLPGGLLIFIIPNTFLANATNYNQFKESLASKADLVDAYRLPNGVFANTQIGTDIVVFKKK